MKNCWPRPFLLLAGIFCSVYLSAQPSVVYKGEGVTDIKSDIFILEDKQGKFTPEEALNAEVYYENDAPVPNLGNSPSTFWLRMEITNESEFEQLLLEIPYPILDRIALYEIDGENPRLVEELGEDFHFHKRTFEHQNFIFNLDIAPNFSKRYLIKVSSGEQILLPLSVGSYQAIYESHITLDLISGIYFGIILVMFLYNLFIYFSVRDRSYLFYVAYILLVGLTQAILKGYAFKYLWPGSPWLALHSVSIVGALVGIATIFFVKDFLSVKKYAPKLNWGLNIIIGLDVIAIILSIGGWLNTSYGLVDLTAGLGALLILVVAIKTYRLGYRPAKFFLLAWSVFLASVLVFVLKDYGIVPYNIYTRYALEIGSAIEVILLSFALADRINILKKEKEVSQAQALKALRENERIIREQNVLLEKKVKERTRELEMINKELNRTLNDLKEAQSQLVDAEKMASLGQLTAGIAHEINNPINFVVSSIFPLKRDIQDLMSIIDKYGEMHQNGNGDLEAKLKEADTLKKELDIDFLVPEIDQILKAIEEGANRTADIVKGLKNFSRLDEYDVVNADINEGLESTVTILGSNLREKNIRIDRQYGELPEINCFAGKLNQVFMNILNNGIHAISKKTTGEEGVLTIKTRNLKDHIEIVLADNGVGMPEEIKTRIFEPFYTTKDVGEGTGLGLSIVYSIIERHDGDIRVNSEEGKGTEFILHISKHL